MGASCARARRWLNVRHGVISNASPWDTAALLGKGSAPERWRQKLLATPACPNFLHWHLALKDEGMAELPIHHVWVGDWQRGIRCCTATRQPTNPGSSGRCGRIPRNWRAARSRELRPGGPPLCVRCGPTAIAGEVGASELNTRCLLTAYSLLTAGQISLFYQRGQRLPIDRQVSLNIKTTDHLGGSDELEKAASGLSLGQNAPCISLEQDHRTTA